VTENRELPTHQTAQKRLPLSRDQKRTEHPTHNGTYGRMRNRTQTVHIAGYALI
jgi:hypothetical protein